MNESKILGPDGQPAGEPELNMQQLLQFLNVIKFRQDTSHGQIVQLGLLIEFLYENLEKQGLKMPMKEFQSFAEKRYKEIQENGRKAMKEQEEKLNEVKQSLADQSLDPDEMELDFDAGKVPEEEGFVAEPVDETDTLTPVVDETKDVDTSNEYVEQPTESEDDLAEIPEEVSTEAPPAN